jgi:hypothetical protein
MRAVAEPLLFRVAFLAPRLPDNTDRRCYRSCLASSMSISISSTHPMHAGGPIGLLAGHVTLAFSIPCTIYYWTDRVLVSTVISHPNTSSSMSKSFAYAQIMTKIIYDDRRLLLPVAFDYIKAAIVFHTEHGAVRVTPVP